MEASLIVNSEAGRQTVQADKLYQWLCDFMPVGEDARKPGNPLIIKDLKTDFSSPKPDNTLKTNPLTRNPKKRILGCKTSDGEGAKLLLGDG